MVIIRFPNSTSTKTSTKTCNNETISFAKLFAQILLKQQADTQRGQNINHCLEHKSSLPFLKF